MKRQPTLFPDIAALAGVVFRDNFAAELREINVDQRTVEHVISDESVDAHGSIIRVDGWDLKRFKRNPVVPFGHDKSSFPIGKAVDVYPEGKKLLAVTQFAGLDQNHPAAETAFALVRDKFLRAWSVGFRPRKWEPRKLPEDEQGIWYDPFIYTDQELMEYSLVPIPSNANALTKARGAGINIDPLLEWLEQRQELVDFCTERGLCLPGINDDIVIPSMVAPPLAKKDPDPPEPEQTATVPAVQERDPLLEILQDFVIEEQIASIQ